MSNQPKQTPGLWAASETSRHYPDAGGEWEVSILDAQTSCVVAVSKGITMDEARERAAALAAAPELLAALILIEKAWADTATNDKPALRSPLYDAMNKARAAIAKAEAK